MKLSIKMIKDFQKRMNLKSSGRVIYREIIPEVNKRNRTNNKELIEINI